MIFWSVIHYLARDKAPGVNHKKCLSSRRSSYCRCCVSICPEEAISFTDKIIVDEKKCLGCSICATACPSRCIKTPTLELEALYQEASQKKRPVIGCRKSQNPEVNVLVPCLGALPAELLTALSHSCQEDFVIDMSCCNDCGNSKGVLQFERSLTEALEITDNALNVTINRTVKNSGQSDDILTRESAQLVGRKIKHIAVDFAKNALSGGTEDQKSSGNSNWHKLLLQMALYRNRFKKLNLTSWSVNAGCTGCQVCQRICPQEAMEMIFREDTARLVHYPLRCTNCGLCSASCNLNALKNLKVLLDNPKDKYRELKRFSVKKCNKCRQTLFTDDGDTTLCAVCKNRESLERDLQFG